MLRVAVVVLIPDDPDNLLADVIDPHVTLVNLPDDPDPSEAPLDAVAEIATWGPPLTATVTGTVVLGAEDDGTRAVALLLDGDDLLIMRDIVVEQLGPTDVDDRFAGWVPHLTVGYAAGPDETAALVEDASRFLDRTITFGAIGVWNGEAHFDQPFTGVDVLDDVPDPDDREVAPPVDDVGEFAQPPKKKGPGVRLDPETGQFLPADESGGVPIGQGRPKVTKGKNPYERGPGEAPNSRYIPGPGEGDGAKGTPPPADLPVVNVNATLPKGRGPMEEDDPSIPDTSPSGAKIVDFMPGPDGGVMVYEDGTVYDAKGWQPGRPAAVRDDDPTVPLDGPGAAPAPKAGPAPAPAKKTAPPARKPTQRKPPPPPPKPSNPRVTINRRPSTPARKPTAPTKGVPRGGGPRRFAHRPRPPLEANVKGSKGPFPKGGARGAPEKTAKVRAQGGGGPGGRNPTSPGREVAPSGEVSYPTASGGKISRAEAAKRMYGVGSPQHNKALIEDSKKREAERRKRAKAAKRRPVITQD